MVRQFLLIAALLLLIRLPFLNQAIQGDDVYYLAGAQHAQIEPAHPNHTSYAFVGQVVQMQGHPHPPLETAAGGQRRSVGTSRNGRLPSHHRGSDTRVLPLAAGPQMASRLASSAGNAHNSSPVSALRKAVERNGPSHRASRILPNLR